ncbi:hypothetical protein O3G_MSEX010678 [Manduca sexta]|uniref:Uncharacterized protein n=1 Tax=Manduca sexta TaxID=7130 RepID=A0A921ZHV4_MANSE|nr:hypothetical protein O3G_MSEX010678 [Manduca sexta]
MAGGSAWWRRVGARTRTLRNLVLDTQRALHDVCDMLQFDPEVPDTVQEIYNLSLRTTALVVLGSTPSARARLLHCLLGRQLLPDPPPRGCRWVSHWNLLCVYQGRLKGRIDSIYFVCAVMTFGVFFTQIQI